MPDFGTNSTLPSRAEIDAEIARRKASREGENLARDLESSRDRCRSLYGFIKEAWHILEPTTPFVGGWAVEAICEHLEAVSDGKIRRLIINCPPGFAKSLIVAVFWPAWEWTRSPSMRYLTSSYELSLSMRDNDRMRDLIKSSWYQRRWPLEMSRSNDNKQIFANVATGRRECRAFLSLTGGRGDRVIIDDPNNLMVAESDVQRGEAAKIALESLPSRVNSEASAIVVIMQRVHETDVTGVLLSHKLGYVHLMLPMEFDPARCCSTPIGFKDPRAFPGELLAPERMSRDAVEELKKSLQHYGSAGQLQQDPVARQGNLFNVTKITMLPAAPARLRKVTRAWDLAGTKVKAGLDPDWTAGVKVGVMDDDSLAILDVVRFREDPGEVRRRVKNVALLDRGGVRVRMTQDPGQAGKDQAQSYLKLLRGFIVTVLPATGEKTTRAQPATAQVEVGNVFMVDDGTGGDPNGWNAIFLAELRSFPAGAHDDQVDAFADAVNDLGVIVPGEGLLEYMRQEAIAAEHEDTGMLPEVADEEMVKLRPPPGVGMAYGIDGTAYPTGPDGVMTVHPDDAKRLAVLDGWARA